MKGVFRIRWLLITCEHYYRQYRRVLRKCVVYLPTPYNIYIMDFIDYQNETDNSIKLPEYVYLFQKAALHIGTEITPLTCKVLFYILGTTVFGNVIYPIRDTMKKDLDISLRTLERSFKELEDMGVLLKRRDRLDNRKRGYMLNPMDAWKGNLKGDRNKQIAIISKEIDKKWMSQLGTGKRKKISCEEREKRFLNEGNQ